MGRLKPQVAGGRPGQAKAWPGAGSAGLSCGQAHAGAFLCAQEQTVAWEEAGREGAGGLAPCPAPGWVAVSQNIPATDGAVPRRALRALPRQSGSVAMT